VKPLSWIKNLTGADVVLAAQNLAVNLVKEKALELEAGVVGGSLEPFAAPQET